MYPTTEMWNDAKAQDYTDRKVFDQIVKKWCVSYIQNFDQIEKIVITFPPCLTRSERYSLHKMSLPSSFKTLSYDDQFEYRILEITLSKSYVQDIFRDHIFDKINDPQEIEPLSERKLLFNALIKFMELNLLEEFNEYLDSM